MNVHGSLLPRWRGAAPISYAIASGDTETGVTVMRIKPKQFDIGEIVMQSKVQIQSNMRRLELHDTLGELGASCLVTALRNLPETLMQAQPQSNIGVTYGKFRNIIFGKF